MKTIIKYAAAATVAGVIAVGMAASSEAASRRHVAYYGYYGPGYYYVPGPYAYEPGPSAYDSIPSCATEGTYGKGIDYSFC
jgi:hypothetical protein